MAAKVGIFATILLVCAILLPLLASSFSDHRLEFLEHDSSKTDVTIHGENNNVVHVNDNDFAIPSSNDETRNERSLKEKKKSKKKKNKKKKKDKKGKKSHEHDFEASNIDDPLLEGGHHGVGEEGGHHEVGEEGVHPLLGGVHPLLGGGHPLFGGGHQGVGEVGGQPLLGGAHKGVGIVGGIIPRIFPGYNVPRTTEEHIQPEINGGLREGFYHQTCPQAEEIIKNGLIRALQNDSTIAAAIPRLFLHDCLVNVSSSSLYVIIHKYFKKICHDENHF